ncbi:19704_t:CDS:2 [Cetraspora pellucida]|uniref:19704_t:CDS:1 n=1 Tax=Cetraspora pellucida TaxID=1433469 RepID=A0A9N9HM04_9GLOM|nr:19704_t:CDS:2 [Cetraspora pellucida]
MPFGISYDVVTTLSRWSIHSFYREIKVVGRENVPREGPLIVCSTHSNMIVDPAVLAVTFPHHRKIHFWAKNSLFANKFTRPILVGGGVVPVDRTTKNNKALFSSTLEVLKLGEIVAVFPEGTSHSESRLMELKDGASWAALEYASHITQQEHTEESNSDDDIVIIKKRNEKQITIIPCGITYVQKSKYRSSLIIVYGSPIQIDPYLKDFLLDNRVAVKALTKRIESEIEKLTINASNWDISNAASMTRMLYFSDDKRVPLEDYVKVTQSLINFFANTTSEEVTTLKNLLNQYKTSLDAFHLTNNDISRYEKHNLTLPWALYSFLCELFKFSIQLPFFLPGLCFHWPIYVLGKVSVKFEKYEESRAQNKIMLGLVWLIMAYTALFVFIWSMWFFTPIGLMFSFGSVVIFAWYHVALVDSHYDTFKELIASFRLLSALSGGRGSKSRDMIEHLVATRRLCLDSLKKVSEDYRSKSDDLRLALEISEREQLNDGLNGLYDKKSV